ncbi:hypothetical protein QAD02_014051 [Eretmocerus hayati]|uniref:Uncharacterized protein n=1 Tax=Eretmocerus hayati TaxID=131215 RepID=A0ACC2P3U7_9HYME|nr:hypothetical protein QAD02_014051 [Eretmocerus hayati]
MFEPVSLAGDEPILKQTKAAEPAYAQCVENVSHANCPVCLEDIHTSHIPCHIPNCGHLLHSTCFKDLLHSGHYACPTCQVSLLDMSDLWRFLDSEVSLTPMPPEYKDYKADILCKDCHEEVIGIGHQRVRGALGDEATSQD